MTPEQTTAAAEFAQIIDQLKKTVAAASKEHLRHAAEVFAANTPEEASRILSEERARRRQQSIEDFNAYTRSPCGCYQDPGGHP